MIVFGVYFYRRKQRKEDDDALAPVHMDDSDMKNPNSFSSSYDEGMLVNDWNRTGKPAMDFSTIVPRNGMNPVSIFLEDDLFQKLTTIFKCVSLSSSFVYCIRKRLKKASKNTCRKSHLRSWKKLVLTVWI